MKRLPHVVMLLVAVALIAANKDEKKKGDFEKIQGEWQAVAIYAKGKRAPKDDEGVKNMRFVIKGNEIAIIHVGSGRERKKTFKLDSTKSPKEMDMTSHDGQEKGQTAACIYKLGKDRLTICLPNDDPSKRPKEFKAKADDGLIVLVLERA